MNCRWKFLSFISKDQRKITTSKEVAHNLLYDIENEANKKEKRFRVFQRVYREQKSK